MNLDGCGVGLRRARRAAPVRRVFLQQLRELRDDLRMGGLNIVRFSNVGGEVIELNRRKFLRGRRTGTRDAPATGISAQFQLPFPPPDCERAIDGMMNQRFAHRLGGPAFEHRQQVYAVLGRILRQPSPEDFRNRRKEIVQADELIAGAARLHSSGRRGLRG